jgi:hypothetical protein
MLAAASSSTICLPALPVAPVSKTSIASVRFHSYVRTVTERGALGAPRSELDTAGALWGAGGAHGFSCFIASTS